MALPLLALIPAVLKAVAELTVLWVTLAAAYDSVLQFKRDLQKLFTSEAIGVLLKQGIYPYAAAEIEKRTGLVLDSDDPFSKKSLSVAIGSKIGAELRDVTDSEALKEDLAGLARDKINEALGTEFEAFYPFDPESIREQAKREITAIVTQAIANGESTIMDSDSIASIRQALVSVQNGQRVMLLEFDGIPPEELGKRARALVLQRARQRRYRESMKRNGFSQRYVQ
jgi:hypothetical protein